MYRFYINNIDNDYHYSELIRVFIPDEEFEVIKINISPNRKLALGDKRYIVNLVDSSDRDTIKRELYQLLKQITGIETNWGTVTGVRPLKIAQKIYKRLGSISAMQDCLRNIFMVSEDKIKLLTEIVEYQDKYLKTNPSEKISVYIGIPFCPTRCAYCSFASNVANSDAEIEQYLNNLLKEIEYMGNLIRLNNDEIESIYIGGGTPTTLNAEQLERLIISTCKCFDMSADQIEYTIEAGRPDTIDAKKLETIRKLGVSRISINPQTMKDSTLELIGRRHKSSDIVSAYKLAKEYGFDVINADIIAGLPEESFDDFKSTLEQVLELGANNITVHTLSIKKGSRMKESDPEYYRRNVETVSKMLGYAHDKLKDNGFYPYYIYKQKHQIGALENVGYCKDGKHSIYNIRIMEEKQTIVGLGAGGIGKVYFPDEDRLERVPNVCNYEIYNERFDEMIERKNFYYGG